MAIAHPLTTTDTIQARNAMKGVILRIFGEDAGRY
jgi:hypothetical protein